MEENQKSHHPVLELAWNRFAELNDNSMSHQDQYMKQRRWIIVLSVLATLFAILVDGYGAYLTGLVGEIIKWILQLLLIMTPITSSAIAAFSNKFQQGQKYLSMRGAAEEILKEMYLYRTVFAGEEGRHKWLNERLANIQRNMFKSIGGELVVKSYTGNVPPYYDPQAGYGDPGFTDLSGQEYLEYRLEDQLSWHIKKIQKLQVERKRIQIFILAFGVLGALFAALGPGFTIWVALTSSLVAAYVGWEELRGLDLRVTNYSRVILELNLIRDYWLTLDEREKTGEEVIKLVRGTEKVLWSQHSEFLKAMQDEFAETEGKEAELIENIIRKSRESADELQQKIFAEAEGVVTEAIDSSLKRVALGVEDSAASVTEGISRISDEIQDYYELQAAAEAEAFVDEIFEDTLSDEISATVDAALAESIAFDDSEIGNFVDEIFDDDPHDALNADKEPEGFVDEIFDDDYESNGDIFDAVDDDDDTWNDISGAAG